MSKAKEFEAAANELAEAYIKVAALMCEQTLPTTKEDALAAASAFAIESQVSGSRGGMAHDALLIAVHHGATAEDIKSALAGPRRIVEAVRASLAKRHG